jgi:DNA helicase II / ATP-dependent DNA helicase PcrA
MDLLDELNPAQRNAVQALQGPVLVLAGPGSGKTRVLTHRVAYLVKECGMDPYNILAVTFTNKAAREMKDRLAKLIGQGRLDRLTVGTFHAICARILRREAAAVPLSADFVIYDSDDQAALIRQALRELNLDDKMFRPPAIQATISKAKRALLAPGEYHPPTYWHEAAGRVYARYQELLNGNHAVDFDDLLMLAARLLAENAQVLHKYQERYIHVLVDEFQDTDSAQYQLVGLLAGQRKNLFAVGDEDQSIYGWRGADYHNVQRFRKDYPEAQVVLLEQNYRSTQQILDAARHVISINTRRINKKLWTSNGQGMPITIHEAYDEQEEAEFIVREIERLVRERAVDLRGCAVMYRTNAQSRVLEDAFVRHGLPYKLVGATRFYERREIKDVIAYLRLVHNPFDDISLTRVLNVPPRGIGDKTRDLVRQWSEARQIPLYTAIQVLVSSVSQQAKGEENGDSSQFMGLGSGLDGRSVKPLAAFLSLLDGLISKRATVTVLELLDTLLADSGYADHVRDGTDEGQERWENIQELRTVARDFASLPPEESLVAFLEQVALVSDVDNLREAVDAATLLTLHMAKGLEFDTVFIAGLEEGILPHGRSLEEPDELEEERRLCYVGMTRAKKRLYLLHTFRRTRFGTQAPTEPSRFLRDIPSALVQGRVEPAAARPRLETMRAPAMQRTPRSNQFSPGDRVRHPQFGEGVVVMSLKRGADEEVTVAFTGKPGIKRMLVSMAGLKLVSRPD